MKYKIKNCSFSGPLQFIRHLLGLLIVKTCPDCSVMNDYLTWLDNIATGDKGAASYIMDKISNFGSGWSGVQSYSFPNFENQFEGA